MGFAVGREMVLRAFPAVVFNAKNTAEKRSRRSYPRLPYITLHYPSTRSFLHFTSPSPLTPAKKESDPWCLSTPPSLRVSEI